MCSRIKLGDLLRIARATQHTFDAPRFHWIILVFYYWFVAYGTFFIVNFQFDSVPIFSL